MRKAAAESDGRPGGSAIMQDIPYYFSLLYHKTTVITCAERWCTAICSTSVRHISGGLNRHKKAQRGVQSGRKSFSATPELCPEFDT